jgi:hypothetical protein
MPNIMIVADTANASDAVFLAERLMTVRLDDAHFAAQLVERLKWAGEDAEQAERTAAIGEPQQVTRRVAEAVEGGREEIKKEVAELQAA